MTGLLKYRFVFISTLLFIGFAFQSNAQIFQFRKKANIKFELINNLIVVPVSLNGIDSLFFIVDTGVGTSLLTNSSLGVILNQTELQKVKISGLGTDDPVDAVKSSNNRLSIKGFDLGELSMLVLKDYDLNLYEDLGKNVHGILGRDLFENRLIKIDYRRNKIIVFSELHNIKLKKHKAISIKIIKGKPIIDLQMVDINGERRNLNFLVDLGSSFAATFYASEITKKKYSANHLDAVIGKGLSGQINGSLARIESVNIGGFDLKDMIVAFPDDEAIKHFIQRDYVDGSVGAEIMRRLDPIFDYKAGRLYLKPNSAFGKHQSYNTAGFNIQKTDPFLPIYKVSYLFGESPAAEAGLEVGDQILSFNGVPLSKLSYQEITGTLYQAEGKELYIKYFRNGSLKEAALILRDLI